MKKLTAVVLMLMVLMGAFGFGVYADMDDGDFDGWFVVCGPAGYSYDGLDYDYETERDIPYHEYLKPGTRLRVQEYDFASKKYMLVVDDDNFTSKGNGILHVTETQLDKYFSGDKKPFKKEYGTKLKKEVKCVVTADVGLMLRQGPAREYPAYKTIPYNTNLSYQYVVEGEDYNWGYVTYKGQAGWACIDYTKKIEAEPETTTTEPTTADETTTEVSAEPTTEKPTEVTTEEAKQEVTTTTQPEEPEEAEEEPAFFSRTQNVIIAVCAGAVVMASTAIVILLIFKRKSR